MSDQIISTERGSDDPSHTPRSASAAPSHVGIDGGQVPAEEAEASQGLIGGGLSLVQFSTGAASAEVAAREVERVGIDRVRLITADTSIEDPDNWRFADEVWRWLGEPEWTVLRDGRTPMEVGWDEGVIPSDRMAVCSRVLKRELIRAHLDATYDPADAGVAVGYDWTEDDRLKASWPHWAPFTPIAPLMDEPVLWKHQIHEAWEERGIERARLYRLGFAHANCGGFCVRGGHAAWRRGLNLLPDRYAQWEANEERLREKVGDYSILTDRSGGGPRRPLTLRDFRLRVTADSMFVDPADEGACGCFMPNIDELADGTPRPEATVSRWPDVRDSYLAAGSVGVTEGTGGER